MAIQVHVSIGLRDDRGVVFGTLQKVSDRHLQVVVAQDFALGQALEFQFSLEGRRTSVGGTAEVVRLVPPELGLGPAAYALQITDMAEAVQAQYREWLYDQALGGGSSSRPAQDHASSIGGSRSSPARQKEGAQRLAALDARREKVTSSIVSSVSGFGKSGTVGRAALREALRARAVERQPGTRSAPSANGSVPPTGAARSAAPERGRAGDGIEIKVSAATDPPRMLVRFTEGVRYRAMLRDHLDKDMLYLRMDPGLAQPGTLYEVRLVLPGDEVVQCSGRVLAVLPSGTAILLSLDDGQRSRMRRAAQVV